MICLKEITQKRSSSYHSKCLKELFGADKIDVTLAESRKDLVTDMPRQTHGFSISGVQMKCQLAVKGGKLQLVDSGGQFIMKPSPEEYPNVAENEHATLKLMDRVGFEVPPCGLLKLNDGHLVFVIRRYDRNFEDGTKYHQEDAMQALGISNADSGQKYTAASYEEVLNLAKKHGGDAVAAALFDRLAFSYLVGNDDHHLKNISFLHEPAFRLAPCYDVLASSLYSSATDSPMALAMLKDGKQPKYHEEMANGYYSGSDFIEMGARAGLRSKALAGRLSRLIKNVNQHAPEFIQSSFMPEDVKGKYKKLLEQRIKFMCSASTILSGRIASVKNQTHRQIVSPGLLCV